MERWDLAATKRTDIAAKRPDRTKGYQRNSSTEADLQARSSPEAHELSVAQGTAENERGHQQL